MTARRATLEPEPVSQDILDSVLNTIDPEILQTFSEEQLRSVSRALESDRDRHRHLVRVQTKLPLLPYYLYLAVGKDRRRNQMRIAQEYRRPRRFLNNVGFAVTLGAGFVALALLAILVLDALVDADLLEALYLRDGIRWIDQLLG
jgi:hypothetical protein